MFNDIKTTYEAAEILKLTQEHIAWLCRQGKFIGAIKKGKTWLIPYEALTIYILQHGNKKIKKQTADQSEEAERA